MKNLFFAWLCLALCLATHAQDKLLPQDSLLSRIPNRYLDRIHAKAKFVQHRLDKGTEKMLKRMEKLEIQLQNKLQKADPSSAEELFGPASGKVSNLKSKLLAVADQTGMHTGYSDNYTDTLQSSLQFLQAANLSGVLGGSQLNAVSNSVCTVKDKLQLTRALQSELYQRKQELNAALMNVVGCKSLLTKVNKEIGYYRQYLDDCKAIFNDPAKAERKTMQLLREYGPFQDFIKKSSVLAGLFNINMDEDPQQALQNLQSRTYIDNRIQQSIGADPAAQQAFSNQMEQSISLIDQVKNKLPASGSVADLDEQRLNPLHTKTFWQRLQYGANVQSQRSYSLMPVMTDFAFQVIYRFNPKLDAGIGLAYKMGWGNSLSHLTLSHEGIGMRAVSNYKIKGRFLATAGLEYNHFSRFENINALKNWNGWTRSTLTGIKIMLRENGRPKASMIILYDFEARRTVPASSAFKIRYEYTF